MPEARMKCSLVAEGQSVVSRDFIKVFQDKLLKSIMLSREA